MEGPSALAPPIGSAPHGVSPRTLRAAEILSRLVAFETVSRSSNLDLVAFVTDYLSQHGVQARLIHDATKTKASILATIGPRNMPGVVLSAHTDVVPCEGQNWATPPFTATSRGGRIFGRGTSDMKGFVAAVLAQVPDLCAAELCAPVHLAFSYDEELGCRGAPDLVKQVAKISKKPLLCIVGEPTQMRVIRGHKGKIARRITIHGRGGHSAYPYRGANAVNAAVQIAMGLRAIARELEARRDAEGFDPPYASVHIGSLHGGTALNLIPETAVLEFEIRSTPKTDLAEILGRIDTIVAACLASLQTAAPESRIESENLIDYPGLECDGAGPAARFVTRLSGTSAEPATISFGTEAGLYAAAGIPTLVCGPGDIARAHIADEWIGLDELDEASAMLDRLRDLLTQPDWADCLN